MKFPRLSRERAGLHLWPGISRQAAGKRLERGTMTDQERKSLIDFLRAKVKELESYITYLKQQQNDDF